MRKLVETEGGTGSREKRRRWKEERQEKRQRLRDPASRGLVRGVDLKKEGRLKVGVWVISCVCAFRLVV